MATRAARPPPNGLMYRVYVWAYAFILANSIRFVYGVTVSTVVLANSSRICFEAVVLRTLKVD